MLTLQIDEELKNTIPRPTDEEIEQLEKNMLRDGRLTDPIFTWHGFIVDGHTRYGIMQKHPDIDFKPKVEKLDDIFSQKDEVVIWMCDRQRGRRNATRQMLKVLMTISYEARIRLRGGSGSKQYQKKSAEVPNGTSANAAKEVANQFDVSVGAVKHGFRFGRGVRVIEEQAPGATKELLAGKAKVADADIEAFPSMSTMEQDEIISALKESRPHRNPKPPKTKEKKENLAKIEAIVDEMYDKEHFTEYTIEMLVESIKSNSTEFVTVLRNLLTDHSTLLTEENKPLVATAMEKYLINDILNLKGLVNT